MSMMRNTTREDRMVEFMEAMGQPVRQTELTEDDLVLLTNNIDEESEEVKAALYNVTRAIYFGELVTKEMLAHLLKELADLQYVLSGCINAFSQFDGVFDAAFNRVHTSNMSKLGDDGKPIKNEYNKVLKGPNYVPPVLDDLIKE